MITVTDGDSFDKLIKDNSFAAVEFYAPWCGHCKKLAPEWEAAAKQLQGGDNPIALAKVDCTTDGNKALAERFGIKGFPTIKIFRDGGADTPTEYEGPREAAGIVTHLRKQAGPPSLLLADAAAVKAFRAFTDDKDTVVIAAFPEGETGAAFEAYTAAANGLRGDYDFGHTTDASLLAEAKGSKGPALVVLQADAEGPMSYDGAFESADLAAWVEKTAAPAVVTLDQSPKNRKALQKVFSNDKPKLLGFVSKGHKSAKGFKEALIEAGKTADKVAMIYAEVEGNEGALDFFGIKAKDTPAFVIHDQAGDGKFVLDGAEASALPQFLKDFEAGKLEKTIKSEVPPEKNDGPVVVLTAKTFNDIVFGKPRNVLIEFYAPWCGHCKKLVPVYEKVGKAFADNDSVVITKFDATANDIPDTKKFQVSGFPTLKLVTADGKVVDYSGDRSEENLIEFVESHADSQASAAGKAAATGSDEL